MKLSLTSEAAEALRGFAKATGIPVAETQAGMGALPYDHPAAPLRWVLYWLRG
ncbi:MAG: hypothetical protein M3309_13850 [Actinomycetota bacterium]|nr:hypothetical protein [Actinomycetota bacterium]